VAGTELQTREALGSRLRDYAGRRGTATTARSSFASPLRGDPVSRLKRPRVVYHDRPHHVAHKPHHVYTYYDRYNRSCHRIIWPRYCYPVYYRYGPYWSYNWCYPYYHRKYVFVSIGGYWPIGSSYLRYYWYGCHPYVWQGYYPIPRQVVTEQHNYYTYNYYTGEEDAASSTALPYGIDDETLAKAQQRLEQQRTEPAAQTLADTRFEEGVKRFERGDFGAAADQFAAAMELAPDDMILPYAHAQALFADGQYSAAAVALRQALDDVDSEKEGVFYPRGLYADEDVLFDQIERLLDKLERYGYDGDLQLLLGYHLLGLGETAYARAPLEQASQDLQNAEAAARLLALLEKMEADAATTSAGEAATESAPAPKAEPRKASPELLERAKDASKLTDPEGRPVEVPGKPAPNEVEPEVERGVLPKPDDTGTETPTPPTPSPGRTAPKPSKLAPPGGAAEFLGKQSQIRAGSSERFNGQPAKKEDDDAVQAA
jgi:Flp pilus assembly protein TadD